MPPYFIQRIVERFVVLDRAELIRVFVVFLQRPVGWARHHKVHGAVRNPVELTSIALPNAVQRVSGDRGFLDSNRIRPEKG